MSNQLPSPEPPEHPVANSTEELFPGETETYDLGIHGKLSHLDAIDLSALSLNKRYVMIPLSGPWISDDYGRFTTSGGAYPHLPGLSDREALVAVRSLVEENDMRTWTIGGTTCWEVAGAYAFKPGLKQAMWERKQIAIRKRKEKAKRRERRKAADAGIPFAEEHDGKRADEDGVLIQEIRTKRGNLLQTVPIGCMRVFMTPSCSSVVIKLSR